MWEKWYEIWRVNDKNIKGSKAKESLTCLKEAIKNSKEENTQSIIHTQNTAIRIHRKRQVTQV